MGRAHRASCHQRTGEEGARAAHGAKVTGPRHTRRSGGTPVAETDDEQYCEHVKDFLRARTGVADEIAALETEAQDKLAEAEDEFKSRSEKIAAILWDVKQLHPEHLDAICERAKIGRSRRYEVLRIGSGRETAKQSRKESAKRQTKSRATKKARAAAESVTVTDSAPKQPKAKQ